MTRRDLADQLLAAADIADELPHGELQVLMRRAALRLRNDTQPTGTVYLDEDLIAVFDELAAEVQEDPMISRSDVVNAALRDWAIGQGYLLPAEVLDEESETDESA